MSSIKSVWINLLSLIAIPILFLRTIAAVIIQIVRKIYIPAVAAAGCILILKIRGADLKKMLSFAMNFNLKKAVIIAAVIVGMIALAGLFDIIFKKIYDFGKSNCEAYPDKICPIFKLLHALYIATAFVMNFAVIISAAVSIAFLGEVYVKCCHWSQKLCGLKIIDYIKLFPNNDIIYFAAECALIIGSIVLVIIFSGLDINKLVIKNSSRKISGFSVLIPRLNKTGSFSRFQHDRHRKSEGGNTTIGIKKFGFDAYGYNKFGVDVSGSNRTFYSERLNEMLALSNKAEEQMKKREFDYALHDVRKAAEIGLKCLIAHWTGTDSDLMIFDSLKICEERCLLDSNTLNKMHHLRRHCNDAQHDNGEVKQINQVYFCIQTLKAFFVIVEQRLNIEIVKGDLALDYTDMFNDIDETV